MIVTQRAHLRIVANNSVPDVAGAVVKRDVVAFANRMRDRLERCWGGVVLAWGVLLLPFRAAAAVWRFVVGMGVGLVRGVISFFYACLGLAFASIAFYMVYQFVTRY